MIENKEQKRLLFLTDIILTKRLKTKYNLQQVVRGRFFEKELSFIFSCLIFKQRFSLLSLLESKSGLMLIKRKSWVFAWLDVCQFSDCAIVISLLQNLKKQLPTVTFENLLTIQSECPMENCHIWNWISITRGTKATFSWTNFLVNCGDWVFSVLVRDRPILWLYKNVSSDYRTITLACELFFVITFIFYTDCRPSSPSPKKKKPGWRKKIIISVHVLINNAFV